LLACNSAEEKERECGSSPQIEITKPPVTFSIQSPENFGGPVIDLFLFQDSMAYVLPSNPKDKIFILNSAKREFVGQIDLDLNFIEFPSGIHVISPDSILVSDQWLPVVFLISAKGEILDSYNLYRENLWEMPQEGFSNFSFYYGFGKTFAYLPERKSLIFPLKQLDMWYFAQEKKNFPTFGEYSLVEKEFKGLHGKYPGVYASDQNHLLPFYLSHPVMEVVQSKVILSYPLDPQLYIYDLDGNLLGEKCASIPEFQLGDLLEYSMEDYDTDGVMNYNKGNSYYGSFFHIKSKNKYVRMFLQCIKDGDETCKSKKLYALIFDQNLDLIQVKQLPDEYEDNFFTYQTAYEDGFLSKTSQLSSDDLFSLSDYFILD
jgi:hypothetical protein